MGVASGWAGLVLLLPQVTEQITRAINGGETFERRVNLSDVLQMQLISVQSPTFSHVLCPFAPHAEFSTQCLILSSQ